jgi:hypothetical protein
VLKVSEYRILLGLGILSILLVGANIGLYFSNQSLQASVNARAEYIQQSVQIKNFYQELAKTLAELAVKNHDDQVKTLLSEEGFTIKAPPANSAPADTSRKAKP